MDGIGHYENDRTSDPIDRVATLAPRELECLRGVAQHKRSAQIGHELNLKPKTVDSYVANAAKKLGVPDRDSAVRLLIEHERRIAGKSLSDFSGVEPLAAQPATSWLSGLPWPFPTKRRPINDLNFVELLFATGAAATVLMLMAVAYLYAISLLSNGL